MQPKKQLRLTPPRILVLGFALTILIGAVLLSLPIVVEGKEPIPFLDALFTATSAVCVTGLVVHDTANTFSTFGEVVIMLLIQVGGLGFMGFATLFALLLGKRVGVKERLILREAYHQDRVGGVVQLVKYIVVIFGVFEGLGALILATRFIPLFGWKKGIYFSVFHSISAFNNAGFDLNGAFGDYSSLTPFVNDPVISLTIPALFIIGGLGFVVIVELFQYRWTRRISLHTKLVLLTTGILVAAGSFGILLIEWGNPRTLGGLSFRDTVVAAFFQGVTPRTAGFNTLDLAGMYPATQFLIILLMFVGASPGSTGGGIKTTTFITMLLAVWSMIRGQDDVVSFRRTIPHHQVYRALTVTVLSMTLVIIVTMLLTITESSDVFHVFFESVSAFGTVGLSLGVTPDLSPPGRILVLITMFIGRLGPMTVAYAVAKGMIKPPIRHPEEKPLIG
ncbi:trk system potassium uptake protein TrkH [Melghirimyces profundicolus]|uniref:Trk system potassium uptake protein TrkH n=1 Tax=Melghirimyces profundicolus TaxID=1242148 RepID=A0A2T6BCD1_9BACL|nr:TrkH family potassium uptake protein [Melghirimyces profundicolus]PTX53713.1 trk system potassium uptake protein TrkH [Melghirimyces profundicolus]